MTLQEKLNALNGKLESELPAEIIAVMGAATVEIRLSDIQRNALKMGDTAPLFGLKDMNGEVVNLVDKLFEGPLLISFFRGNWCPYCIEELRALNRYYSLVHDAGASIVGITSQQPRFNQKLAKDEGIQFDLLTDVACKLMKGFGIVYQLPTAIKRLYGHFGIDLERYNGASGWHLPLTSRFVIGSDAKILCAHIDIDYSERTEPKHTIDVLLKALRTKRN
ncbi:peroxiredoxin-like family protein [Oleidesulfovibrio sp.]|uniref:peroxiredoxin-like family protein n=1 Tax=Oleidesulfovibrio sp. TaxID=2909707 RepID=UPI003A85F118